MQTLGEKVNLVNLQSFYEENKIQLDQRGLAYFLTR